MAQTNWRTKRLSVAGLLLDEKNPRIGPAIGGRSPREIIQYLFDHDKAIRVARSIAAYGYFESEPLLAIPNGRKYVVVEGNRRLAALKALREPRLLTGARGKEVRRLSQQIDLDAISKVPVTVAPDRRATDPIVAVRHGRTPILPWEAENRANFILEKLDEGYTNEELRDELGYTDQDIQKAKQTRAIVGMARALDLPEEVRDRVDSPRVKLFSTLTRVFESSVGRQNLKIQSDADHGIRGFTSKDEFKRALAELVSDIALQRETSRSLNKNENIREYFEQRNTRAIAKSKPGAFVPDDIISAGTSSTPKPPKPRPRTRRTNLNVVPRNFKVVYGNDRLVEIRAELGKLKRETHPNAGAVLLRVFLELAIKDYLDRTGRLEKLIEELEQKNSLPSHGLPQMRRLAQEITKVAKDQLSRAEARLVEKALRHDPAAPFTVNDLHSFVHSNDFPGERDIRQFWERTEPLFRLMLEREPKVSGS